MLFRYSFPVMVPRSRIRRIAQDRLPWSALLFRIFLQPLSSLFACPGAGAADNGPPGAFKIPEILVAERGTRPCGSALFRAGRFMETGNFAVRSHCNTPDGWHLFLKFHAHPVFAGELSAVTIPRKNAAWYYVQKRATVGQERAVTSRIRFFSGDGRTARSTIAHRSPVPVCGAPYPCCTRQATIWDRSQWRPQNTGALP